MQEAPSTIRSTDAQGAPWPLSAAWIVSLVSTLGALFVGEVMGQVPCELCWYQRILIFPLAVVLGIAAFKGDRGVRVYVVPLSVLGAAVAGFHSLLYAGLVPESIEPCGRGPSCASADMTILGGLPLPFLSLAGFVVVALLLTLPRKGSSA
ncbi:disulfide bond formation protein B [Antarcticirhabdus aurantiaca]|uniref:Disulfide bond formation protein B n=1 Tax=Antarcticirhabdus aurantiaca TaxID=2606717 RepID=A0ACD4NWZ7_9HYPH|nr:disulfide bond formation protein B [Antarcticirhabdus aurantiaca]WAJ31258.1 disulfide bond formation protein B [Jeongeuplla avenae]